MTPPWHPILLWDTLSILKKISGEFGVWPATFSKSAQNFVKKCQKIAPGVHFLRKNVVPCWCNTKKNNTNFFYMLILTACNRVTRRNDFRPLEGSGALLCGVCRTSKNRIFLYYLQSSTLLWNMVWKEGQFRSIKKKCPVLY